MAGHEAAADEFRPLKVGQGEDDLVTGVQHELEKEVQVMVFYAQPWWKLACFSLLCVLSMGSVWLVSLWYPVLFTSLTMSPSTPEDAECVYIELLDKRCGICKVHRSFSPGFKKMVRWFMFHSVRFFYSDRQRAFRAVAPAPLTLPAELLHASRAVGEEAAYAPSVSTRQKRHLLFGENLLQVEAPSFWRIFGYDAAQPFYCFQYASVAIWMYEEYYTYSAVVLAITLASIVTNVVSQYKERKRMADMAYYVCDVERVSMDAAELSQGPKGVSGHLRVSSPTLVPGDMVVVVPGKASCDMVLLDGEVVVDETILTGESVPVRKVPYNPDMEGPYCDSSSHCTIYNGTSVVAARGGRGGKPALALVSATGFSTAKGQLLRTVMFPVQHDLQFVKQAMYFICMMLVVACGFYLWNVVAMISYHASARSIAVKALDLITVAVPPALACCLAIATTISVARLKKRGVHVQDNDRVRVAGLLDTICFDKTGTLTDIGLEFGGAVPASKGRFGRPIFEPSKLPPSVSELFSTCHGLTQLQQQVVGDPLDQRLFEASGFEMQFEDQLPPFAFPPPSAPSSTAISLPEAAPPGYTQQQQQPPSQTLNVGRVAAATAVGQPQVALSGEIEAAAEPLLLLSTPTGQAGRAPGPATTMSAATASAATNVGAAKRESVQAAGIFAGPYLVVRRCSPTPVPLNKTTCSVYPQQQQPQQQQQQQRRLTAPTASSPARCEAPMPLQHHFGQQRHQQFHDPVQQKQEVPVSSKATDTALHHTLDHSPLLLNQAYYHLHPQPHGLVAFDSSSTSPNHASSSSSILRPLVQVESVGASMMDSLAAISQRSSSSNSLKGLKAPVAPDASASKYTYGDGASDKDEDEGTMASPLDGASAVGQQHHGIHMATEPFPPSESLHVLRRFDFSSERLRSTCVALHPDGRVVVHVKGSPERLLALMDPASVPSDFLPMLQEYTNQGLRVIGMASRELPGPPCDALRLSQDELEAGCLFMGLVLMVNRLKPESAPTIAHLHGASIRTAMVTGDHVRTAINVARQCAIMDAAAPAVIVDVRKGGAYGGGFTFEVVPPVESTPGSTPAAFQKQHSAQAAEDDDTNDASHRLLHGKSGSSAGHEQGVLPQSQKQQHHHQHHHLNPDWQQQEQELAVLSPNVSLHAQGRLLQTEYCASHAGLKGEGDASHTQPKHKQQSPPKRRPPLPAGFLEQYAAMRHAASGAMQIAVTGAVWQQLISHPESQPELMDLVLQRGRVFARMSPESKRGLLGLLGFGDVDANGHAHPGCGFYTGFCGDGANDMGALKGALVGVSLCDAEASIAAPMTSRIPHVGVMVTVVAEGRCSMITSLIIFKYTMVYAFIQVLSLALLYSRGLTVGNFQYLLQDMLHTTLLASCMALTKPARKLGLQRPPSRVLCMAVILPVLGQLAVDTLFQLLALYMLEQETWFEPFDTSAHQTLNIDVSEERPEAGVLFIVACWQLVINALVFNVGKPFRRGLWTNVWLLGTLTVLVTFDMYVLWAPGDTFRRKVPAIVDLPLLLRAKLFGLILSNLVAAYTADWAITQACHLLGPVFASWHRSAPQGYQLASLSAALGSISSAEDPGCSVTMTDNVHDTCCSC